MITSWYSQLDRAKSASEAVGIARDFMATWSPEELALRPPSCRPGRLRDELDIEELHGTLVETYRQSRATGKELEALQRLTSFVVRASIRIAEISGESSGGGGGFPSPGPGSSASPGKG